MPRLRLLLPPWAMLKLLTGLVAQVAQPVKAEAAAGTMTAETTTSLRHISSDPCRGWLPPPHSRLQFL